MPTDSNTDAITMSITRNGRKSTAPIWKPVFSSERNVGREQDLQVEVGGLARSGRLGDLQKQGDVLLPGSVTAKSS